jgi:hypothetical protein
MREDIPRSPANSTWREYMEFEARIHDDWDELQLRMHRKRSRDLPAVAPKKAPETEGTNGVA